MSIAELEEQQKQAEVNFHQIAGAMAMVQQQLDKAKESEAKDSSDEKKKK